jgi:hypothetical protein
MLLSVPHLLQHAAHRISWIDHPTVFTLSSGFNIIMILGPIKIRSDTPIFYKPHWSQESIEKLPGAMTE